MGGSFERGNETLGSIKVRTVSSLLEVLLSFQEGPCSIQSSPRLANISQVQCPNCLSTHFEEIISRAHGNFEVQNKALEPSVIIINYCIILKFIGQCIILIVEQRQTNLMSLALLFHYLLLNMFRMLVHPSSGACDLLWIYFMCCIPLVRCVLVLRCAGCSTLQPA